MQNNTTWENVSTQLTKVLEAVKLRSKDAEAVMTEWKNNRDAITTLLTTKPARKRATTTKPKGTNKQTGYLLFCEEQRAVLKNSEPTLKGTDVMRRLGGMWKEMTPTQKETYNTRATQQNNANGLTTTATTTTTSSKTKKPAMTATAQPQPSSLPKKKETTKDTPGFNSFVQETQSDLQEQHPSWPSTRLTEECRRRWNKLTTEQREQYENDACSDEEVEEEQ